MRLTPARLLTEPSWFEQMLLAALYWPSRSRSGDCFGITPPSPHRNSTVLLPLGCCIYSPQISTRWIFHLAQAERCCAGCPLLHEGGRCPAWKSGHGGRPHRLHKEHQDVDYLV